MTKPILRNTSLCAIIRDEMMNPAGGIIDFVENTVPYVEEAVMVDTGSVDGTKDVLVELAKKYSNMNVISHQYHGNADARNKSLSLANNNLILVLDADERFTLNDFMKIKDFLDMNTFEGYDFDFKDIYLSEEKPGSRFGNPRLFMKRTGLKYKDSFGHLEYLVPEIPSQNRIDMPVAIKHFRPEPAALEKKYAQRFLGDSETPLALTPGFSEWKAYNRMREHYK